MPFTENLKLQVKEKAHFRCCRCQNIGVEIHHIIPQQDNGEDDLENAAPLCPSCHAHFGGNPEKRKEIKEMRNWWYKKCEDMYPKGTDTLTKPIHNKLDEISHEIGEQKEKSMAEFKNILKQTMNEAIEKMTYKTASSVASSVVATATTSITGKTQIEDFINAFQPTTDFRIHSGKNSMKIDYNPATGTINYSDSEGNFSDRE